MDAMQFALAKGYTNKKTRRIKTVIPMNMYGLTEDILFSDTPIPIGQSAEMVETLEKACDFMPLQLLFRSADSEGWGVVRVYLFEYCGYKASEKGFRHLFTSYTCVLNEYGSKTHYVATIVYDTESQSIKGNRVMLGNMIAGATSTA